MIVVVARGSGCNASVGTRECEHARESQYALAWQVAGQTSNVRTTSQGVGTAVTENKPMLLKKL